MNDRENYRIDAFPSFSSSPEPLRISACTSSESIDGPFAASVLSTALDLLTGLIDLWKDLPSAKESFHPLESKFLPQLTKFAASSGLHQSLRDKVDVLEKKLAGLIGKKAALAQERSKTKMLKMYEPEIEDK